MSFTESCWIQLIFSLFCKFLLFINASKFPYFWIPFFYFLFGFPKGIQTLWAYWLESSRQKSWVSVLGYLLLAHCLYVKLASQEVSCHRQKLSGFKNPHPRGSLTQPTLTSFVPLWVWVPSSPGHSVFIQPIKLITCGFFVTTSVSLT